MSPADEARAYELVRVNKLSYVEAGKILGGLPKSTVRAAVTREAVRRATLPPPVVGVLDDDNALALAAPGDAGFVAALLAPPAPAPTPVPDRLHVAPPDEDEDELNLDVESMLRRQIKKLEGAIEECNQLDRAGEAQKYSRTLQNYLAQLRQEVKSKREADGVLTYSLEDVARTEVELEQMARDVAHRGLVCAECGRAMRRAEAEGT